MATKLTKMYLERIESGTSDSFHWDSEVKGFGVRITPQGKIRFVVQGRVAGSGKEARITIGAYGVFTVEQARNEAREHLRNMRLGTDPRDLKRQDASMRVTLQQIADAYVSRPGKLKDSSRQAIERIVSTSFEAWKDKPVVTISETMCKARYRELLTKGLRGKKGAPGQANQAFSVLSALLNYAARQYRRADGAPLILLNPVAVLKDDRIRLKPRTSRILDNKVGAVWSALSTWREQAHNRDTQSSIDLVRFLILTGLRRNEAASLTWEQVNLDDGYFHLPNPKNGHAVFMPLSMQARKLLHSRPRVDGNPYVFPSWGQAGHIKDPRNLMTKVSTVAGNTVTLHDLRRTYTNVALRSCRIEKFRVDLLTNHITRDVTAEHYFDTTNLQWLQPEAQKIADFLDTHASITEGKNVVQIGTTVAA